MYWKLNGYGRERWNREAVENEMKMVLQNGIRLDIVPKIYAAQGEYTRKQKKEINDMLLQMALAESGR